MERVSQILKFIRDVGFVEGGALAAALTPDDRSFVETCDYNKGVATSVSILEPIRG
jgi:hypothetical protein